MNLKIKPGHQVNHHTAGTVLSVDHIEGGDAEAARLFQIGCIEPTEEAVTVELPLSLTAVAEMDDDALTAENTRLRKKILAHNEELEFRKAELNDAQDKIAELEAKLVEANGEIIKLKGSQIPSEPVVSQPTPEPVVETPPTEPTPVPAAAAAPTPAAEPVKTITRRKS